MASHLFYLSVSIILSFGLVSCSESMEFDFDAWRKDAGIEKWGPDQDPISINDTTDYNWPADSLLHRKYSGVETARRRARQLADIKWKPYTNVPSCYGYYPKGNEQQGIPYSLAYMTNTQVGTQVSLHTYMTALQHPYSLLYSEHLGRSPYNGSVDSATYYGTTCSNSVMYVLGIEPPYYTRMIGSIPGMMKAKEQSPSAVESCDILWKSGHVLMVYDVFRNEAGEIERVSLFETTRSDQRDTWIHDLTYEAFAERWSASKYVRYQYTYLERNTDYGISVFMPLVDEPVLPFRYNYELCPTLGDRCSYLIGQNVDLAVMTESYPEIAIYRGSELYKTVKVTRPVTSLADLPYGSYRACLIRDGVRSGYVRFEIIDAGAEALADDKIHIRFSCKNASPRYVSICNSKGVPFNYYLISDRQRKNELFEINSINSSGASHYQVFFRGKYGVVATPVKKI